MAQQTQSPQASRPDTLHASVSGGIHASRPRVLAADDQAQIREALTLLLQPEGYEVDCVASPQAALNALVAEQYDVMLMDLNYTRDTTSGREGMDLLQRVLEIDAQLPVIVMTAWASVDLAVEAMRHGARDFIQKPWENNRLLAIVQTQVELRHALRRAQVLEAENRLLNAVGRPELIASAPAMRPVLDAIARVGPSNANVLITGEHGTGKEVVARTLHALSLRAQSSFVAVNTGALSEGVFESELFGHVKGAFTDARADRIGRFELADGGTLFLDEIANVPMRQQAKLLRVLESGEIERVGSSRTRRVDVRLLSATNADLQAESKQGNFREDLLFRLNTVEIHLPALRERREDIPALAAHFLARHAVRYRKEIEGFEPAALQALLQHTWPGNVRELDHTMERAVLMCRGERITQADLNLQSHRPSASSMEDLSLEAVESILIRKALAKHERNVSLAAEALGLSRGALYRRMEKYGL
ncbi:MAG TPA: sigma-54 dependent transcriptional regulator [Acidobacteriaceae bacterium]|nr:sigma-54 dependent transcriptional regulator [Acidobacteriaceae bacterium]